jgi:hypothetical protein
MNIVEYDNMPRMEPIPIATKGKGFFQAIWIWLWASRQWQISEDWHFKIHGSSYVITKGFIFDGASIPKYFWNYLSPVGVLLMPGLIHDWVYKYQYLKCSDGTQTKTLSQKDCDIMFRDLAIEINGFVVINHIAYYALRAFGWMAWNKHRKNK